MKKYAVIGNPIAHSQSPEIHAAFAAQFQMDLSYEKILSLPDDFEAVLKSFQAGGGLGVNVTLPFKQIAWELVRERTPRAEKACAVNTILFRDHQNWLGDNTDGIGLLNDLKKNLCLTVQDKKILILGAGGAVRGILEPLLLENPRRLFIANRHFEKAKKLADAFSEHKNVTACPSEMLSQVKVDLIIHATAAGLQGETVSLPHEIFHHTVCYDLAYGDAAKPFLTLAQANKAAAYFDGLGMLVEQAAESFELWHHQRPDTKSVISLFRKKDKKS
jgi:shikimate dehydrogenase